MGNMKYCPFLIIILGFQLAGCKKDKPGPSGEYSYPAQEEAFPGKKGEPVKVAFYGTEINCERINGIYVYQGDIIIDESQIGKSPILKGAGTDDTDLLWPDNTVPFVINKDFPEQDRITGAIAYWEEHTSLVFVQRTDEKNYIEFIWDAEGCSSNVGMIGKKQFIHFADWGVVGTAIHEIGHAIGLFHEHSKSNRDDFVLIIKDNILAGKEGNFDIHKNSIITDGFDFGSIMLYPSNAFSKNGKSTITKLDGSTYSVQRENLSDQDLEAVAMLYESPVAEFEADKIKAGIGVPFEFTDKSSNEPTTWSWDFGDGSNSTDKNPRHTYSTEGTFTVTLTAANEHGSDKMTKTGFITTTWNSGPDSFIDPRDGQTYSWKLMGTKIWMADNLNFSSGSGTWCYDNWPSQCSSFGKLYNQKAAQVACPDGWSLPSDGDWKDLETLLGMLPAVLDQSGFRGTNQGVLLREGGSSGLEIKFAGWRSDIFSSFSDAGSKAMLWTGSADTGSETWMRELSLVQDGVARYKTLNSNGLSIRCIRNQ